MSQFDHNPPRGDRILIKNLLVRGILGINPDERIEQQDILLNLEIWTDIEDAAASDDIEHALNYRSLTKQVIAHVQASRDHLVEKLVSDLANLVLDGYSASAVRVRVEKPGALRFAESVGIEIVRHRAPR